MWHSTPRRGKGHLLGAGGVGAGVGMRPARRREERAFSNFTRKLPSFPCFAGSRAAGSEVHPDCFPLVFEGVGGGSCHASAVRTCLRVFTQPPGHDTTSVGQDSMAHWRISLAEERMSSAMCVMPARV